MPGLCKYLTGLTIRHELRHCGVDSVTLLQYNSKGTEVGIGSAFADSR